MIDYPIWFFDEKLMKQFFDSGGGDPSRDTEMRTAVDQYLKAHPHNDVTEIGYLTAEAPIGAERGRWMLRPLSTKYMPLMLQVENETVAVDPQTLESEKVNLARLSPQEFLNTALTKLFIQKR